MQPVNVDEPDIESAIAIMRGLKRRYEAHHGVTLQDQALVVAVKLAKRYITGRKLPDSSIDLVDEACANIRVQLDSKPEALDKLERRRLQLQIEAKALESEKDPMSRTRLERVREELAGLEERLRGLELKYHAEKDRVVAVTEAKRRIDQLQRELETAQQALDLEKAARLQYGDIPEAQKRLTQLELEAAGGGSASALALPPSSATAGAAGTAAGAAGVPAPGDDFKLVSDVVGPDEIAEVVARWTGIPVTKVGGWLLFPRLLSEARPLSSALHPGTPVRYGPHDGCFHCSVLLPRSAPECSSRALNARSSCTWATGSSSAFTGRTLRWTPWQKPSCARAPASPQQAGQPPSSCWAQPVRARRPSPRLSRRSSSQTRRPSCASTCPSTRCVERIGRERQWSAPLTLR